jgi:peptide/nickel transport system permease protein
MLILRKFMRDVSAVLGFGIIVALCLVAIFSPLIISDLERVYDGDLTARLLPPSAEYWFGTDSLGRDVFARVIVGSRGALHVALSVVALAIGIGVPAGLYAGYTDGWGSQLVMRVTDVFLAVPQLILALSVAQLMGRGLGSAMAALALTYWPFFCRTVYSEVRRLRSALFIEAQQCLGASTSRILFVHVLPNVASAVIVRATIGMGFTIMTTAVLGFLGVGATPPNPDWGLAVAEGRDYLPQSWWAVTFPGLGIFITVLGFNLFGDGLRDIVDPKLRRSR